MFAQAHAKAGCAQMAAILVRAEIAMIQVFGEMDMAERVASAKGKQVVMPGEPAQRFSPLALAAIAVRVVREGKAACDGKVVAVVIQMAVPAFREQVKQSRIKSRRDGIAREAAGNRKAFQRI